MDFLKRAAAWAPGSTRDRLALAGLLGLGAGATIASGGQPAKGLAGVDLSKILGRPAAPPPSGLLGRVGDFASNNKVLLGLAASGVGGTLLARHLVKRLHEREQREKELAHARELALAQASAPRIQQIHIPAFGDPGPLKEVEPLSIDGLPAEGQKTASLWGAAKSLGGGLGGAVKELWDPARAKRLLMATGRGVRGTGQYVDKGLGLHQLRNSRTLYNRLMSRPGLRKSVDALTSAGRQAGVGPSMLSLQGFMSPLSQLGAKFTRPGYLRWLTEQVGGNTKQWQRIKPHLDPKEAARIESMLTRRRLMRDPVTGEALTAAGSVSRTAPGWRHLPVDLAAQSLVYYPFLNATFADPAKRLLGWDKKEAPPPPTITDRAKNLGYGLYRGLSGGGDPYAGA